VICGQTFSFGRCAGSTFLPAILTKSAAVKGENWNARIRANLLFQGPPERVWAVSRDAEILKVRNSGENA
jgi:hypothetical protein